MEFKGTKGNWFYDENTKGIKNINVKGLLATAWSVYDSDTHEERLKNESWLSMRERSKYIRDNCELEQLSNAKLIACAPEMLFALQEAITLLYGTTEFEVLENYRKKVNYFELLIKKATE